MGNVVDTEIKDFSMNTPMTNKMMRHYDWSDPYNFRTLWPRSAITSLQYDSFKHAFKVAKMLIDKELVKGITVGDFLTLVADIEMEL